MTTTIKSGAGVSRYLRLYQVLSQALAEACLGAGEALASEPRLMREYGVSRSTVRRALARLEAEGRIERKRGSGTFVRNRRGGGTVLTDVSAMLDGAASPPAAISRRTVAFRRVPTPAFLLAGEGGFGARTLLVRQIRHLEREPIVLETAYVPEEIGRGLTRQRLGAERGSILTALAAAGHPGVSREREFTALEADPLAAKSLGIAVGAPVFNVCTLARDPQQRVVAYVSCLYRPDRYQARVAIDIGRPKRELAARRS
ncbi:MAG: GntR family transcriptional regulator [Steroidobacteraceae bacterium]